MTGRALANAAESLVGSRFLLHGRDPAIGLDCVGVLAAALAAIGQPASLPDTYTLRTRVPTDLARTAACCGLAPAAPPLSVGDIALVRISACQLHLLVALGPGEFVHADAASRRVARLCGSLEWPIVGLWRLIDADGE